MTDWLTSGFSWDARVDDVEIHRVVGSRRKIEVVDNIMISMSMSTLNDLMGLLIDLIDRCDVIIGGD